MVAGHTKFDPDLVAQHVAGGYNSGDTFSHAQLRLHVEPHATSIAYDGTLPESWKAGPPSLCEAVPHIMSYRQFLCFADDGQVDLREAVPLPVDMEPFPDSGLLFDAQAVASAMTALARRTLVSTVLPKVLAKTHRGIGSHDPYFGGSGDARPSRLLPYMVTSF